MTDLHNRLDDGAARRVSGQFSPDDGLDPALAGLEQLEVLRLTPALDAKTTARGRQIFLAQAREMLLPNRRQKQKPVLLFNFKEFFAMSPTWKAAFVTLLIVAMLVFGGGSATALAAQSSLPAEPLYGLKIAVEDARLGRSTDPAATVRLSTEFAARRIEEMEKLAAANRPIPPELLARLDMHLTQALLNAANMESSQASLEQIQQMTELQSLILTQALNAAPGDPMLEQAAQYLEIVHNLTTMGLTDPGQFRNQILGPGASTMPTATPSVMPTMFATSMPSAMPTSMPSAMPTMMPSAMPTSMPSAMPTMMPSAMPTSMPSAMPTMMPSAMPTSMPSAMPTMMPSAMPTSMPSAMPTMMPSAMPTGMGGHGGGGMP